MGPSSVPNSLTMKMSELTPEQIQHIISQCRLVPCTVNEVAKRTYSGYTHANFIKIFEEQYKDLPSPIRSEE